MCCSVPGGFPYRGGTPCPDLARGVLLLLIKYSMCCPVPGVRGTPGGCPLTGSTPPHPDLARGFFGWVLPLWRGCPWLEYPLCPDLAGGTPGRAPPGWGTPILTCPGGYPRRVPPILTWLRYPPQVWTDWKHYLPSSFGCGRQICWFGFQC